jgi:hypothetical protein
MACLSRRKILALITTAAFLPTCTAQNQSSQAVTSQLTRAQKEEFLRTAKVVRSKGAPGGITGALRLTMTDGTLTRDACFQSIDEAKLQFQSARGTEMNFRDTWKFNVAAYKLDQILGLNMVPVTVERSYGGKTGSLTWWVDDVLMTETEMFKKKIAAPDSTNWECQRQIVRVFDELIYNTDRNLGNLVIDKNWQIWMIDHTRAFRIRQDLLNPKVLIRCDGGLLEAMKRLDATSLQELSKYLNRMEILGLLKRRDKIVEALEKRGPSALYTLIRRPS